MERQQQRMVKMACIELDGNVKLFHDRITADGETIKLKRIYEIIQGFKIPTEAEQRMFAQKLQRPVWMLFTREVVDNDK